MSRKPILERAYELARSGAYGGVTQVKKALIAEGYDAQQQVVGAGLIRSLLAACRAATGVAVRPPAPSRRRLTSVERSESARRGAAKRFGRDPQGQV
jgi:hypothetical protein